MMPHLNLFIFGRVARVWVVVFLLWACASSALALETRESLMVKPASEWAAAARAAAPPRRGGRAPPTRAATTISR